jgi:hypothetical protein
MEAHLTSVGIWGEVEGSINGKKISIVGRAEIKEKLRNYNKVIRIPKETSDFMENIGISRKNTGTSGKALEFQEKH